LSFKDGKLATFQRANLAAIPEYELDILVFRNRAFPDVLRHLFPFQLARIVVPETVQEDRAYRDWVASATPGRPLKTSELHGLIETFVLLRDEFSLPSDVAGPIVALAYDLVAQEGASTVQ
jgi:hypothetical protein